MMVPEVVHQIYQILDAYEKMAALVLLQEPFAAVLGIENHVEAVERDVAFVVGGY